MQYLPILFAGMPKSIAKVTSFILESKNSTRANSGTESTTKQQIQQQNLILISMSLVCYFLLYIKFLSTDSLLIVRKVLFLLIIKTDASPS